MSTEAGPWRRVVLQDLADLGVQERLAAREVVLADAERRRLRRGGAAPSASVIISWLWLVGEQEMKQCVHWRLQSVPATWNQSVSSERDGTDGKPSTVSPPSGTMLVGAMRHGLPLLRHCDLTPGPLQAPRQ